MVHSDRIQKGPDSESGIVGIDVRATGGVGVISVLGLVAIATLLIIALGATPTYAAEDGPGFEAAAKATPLRFLIVAPDATDTATLYQALTGISIADAKATGHFTWDVARGEITNAVDDVVASVKGGDLETQIARVQGVIDTWTVLRALDRDTTHRTLDTHLEPDDQVHHEGERVTVVVGGNRTPYFTLFNLASDGTVNFIYPIDEGRVHDSPTIPLDGPYRLPLQITPPFGADHFIAIASAARLTTLHQELKALDGKQEAVSIPALLDRTLRGQVWELGLQAVLSAR